MHQGPLPGARVEINIASLTLLRTGTYNPMFLRPYTANCDQTDLDIIGNRVAEAKGAKITSELITGVASRVIRPDATPHALIHIPSGWNEPRVSFIMEVHAKMNTGFVNIYYFQGYTNYCGISQANIDPKMVFIINSFMEVSRVPRVIDGMMQHVDSVINSAQVINGKIMNQSIQNGLRMAPLNLFHGSQSNGMNNAYRHYKNEAVSDTRVALGLDSYRSDRSNNVASSYLAKILEAQARVSYTSGIGNGFNDVADMQYGYAYEPPVNENVFISAISRLEHSMCTTEFTMATLTKIDSTVASRTNLISLGVAEAQQMHSAGQTEYWTGSNRETQIATMLSNAIPSLMMSLMIGSIRFRCTNDTIGCAMDYQILDARTLSNLDLRNNFNVFMQRLDREVLFDVTYGNNVRYTLDVEAHLFAETKIKISLDYGGVVEYTIPTFCDSVTSPVIADSPETFHGIVNTVDLLANTISSAVADARPSSAVITERF